MAADGAALVEVRAGGAIATKGAMDHRTLVVGLSPELRITHARGLGVGIEQFFAVVAAWAPLIDVHTILVGTENHIALEQAGARL